MVVTQMNKNYEVHLLCEICKENKIKYVSKKNISYVDFVCMWAKANYRFLDCDVCSMVTRQTVMGLKND
jgi:hypothetical protein